ncbi:MAG: ABC transporter substrate-binding protein [Thermoproteota archaeon]|nr:ABC transporter substrate-binding protein [Candidatus Brockarchaeota archaeon]
MQISFKVIIVLILTTSLISPQVIGQELTPKLGGTLVVIQVGDPKSFNPDAQVDDMGFPIFQNLFDKLVTLDIDYNIIPDLAYKWDVSSDGLIYTFYLYKNATWHDGVPVTAWDVKWTFETINKSKGIAYSWIKASNIKSIDVVDNYTVRFVLKQPFAAFLSFLAWYGTFVMPKHIYQNFSDWMDPKNAALQKPIGSGPFKFVEWVKGDHVTLEANDNYFKGRPYLDKLVFKIIPDANTALSSFLAGEGDVLAVRPPFSEIPKLNSTSGVIVIMRPVPSRWYLGFNLLRYPFNDKTLRLAIAYAINRTYIVEKALYNYGFPAEGGYVPAIKWAFNPNAKLPEYNVSLANKLLDEAGYKLGSDGIRVTPNGTKLSIKYTYFTTGPETEAIGVIIKEQLKKIGIDVTLEGLEIGTWEQKVVRERNFDIALCDGFEGPDPDNMRSRFALGAYLNFANYSNVEYLKLLENASTTTNFETRKELYWKAQEVFVQDLAYLPLVDLVAFYIWKKEFHGLPWESSGKVNYNSYAITWWEKGKSIEPEYITFLKSNALTIAVVVVGVIILGIAIKRGLLKKWAGKSTS